MTALDDLLDLQHTDTRLDQLRHRRTHAPEHDAVATTHGALAAAEKRRTEVSDQLDELARKIRTEEAAGADLSAEQVRLEKQLRTVIAPREAEALMHEIATIKGRHSELDDAELEHLETQERLDAETAELDAQDEPLRSAVAAADAALAAQLATIDEEIDAAVSQRASQQDRIPAALLDRYEALRKTFGGVAVARLNGRQCEGCHLDIAAAEIDALKATPPEELPECPQCGRLIVV